MQTLTAVGLGVALVAGCPGGPPPPRPAAGAVGAASTAPPAPGAPTPLAPGARLYRASNSGYAEPATLVLTSAAAWAAVWRTLQQGLEAGAPPAVDFARQVVALLATGERPTGGYAVRVDGTSAAPGGGLAVHVTRTAPGAGCMTAHVVTAPAEAVRLPRPAAGGRVTFAVRDISAPC